MLNGFGLDEFWIALGGGFVVLVIVGAWSAWKYDNANRVCAEQQRQAQKQLDQSDEQIVQAAEQQRLYLELLEHSVEQQRRWTALIERQEALLTAAEALIRRLDPKA